MLVGMRHVERGVEKDDGYDKILCAFLVEGHCSSICVEPAGCKSGKKVLQGARFCIIGQEEGKKEDSQRVIDSRACKVEPVHKGMEDFSVVLPCKEITETRPFNLVRLEQHTSNELTLIHFHTSHVAESGDCLCLVAVELFDKGLESGAATVTGQTTRSHAQ